MQHLYVSLTNQAEEKHGCTFVQVTPIQGRLLLVYHVFCAAHCFVLHLVHSWWKSFPRRLPRLRVFPKNPWPRLCQIRSPPSQSLENPPHPSALQISTRSAHGVLPPIFRQTQYIRSSREGSFIRTWIPDRELLYETVMRSLVYVAWMLGL